MKKEVIIYEKFPPILGAPSNRQLSGIRKAISADGEWWLVRRRGIFRRWRWLPRDGRFVKLQEVKA